MKNILDLRTDGVLSVDLARKLTVITELVRKEYTEYIGDLIKLNSLSGLDLLVNVTCRNPYQTKIFDNFCKLKLLELCLQENISFDSVLVSDQGMCDSVKSLSKKYAVNINLQCDVALNAKKIFVLTRRLFVSIYIIFISLAALTFISNKRKVVPNQSIVYLDTYMKADDFKEDGSFYDHYYSGLIDNVPQNIAQKIWYAPFVFSLRRISDLKWIIKQSRKSKYNFLLMEEWLRFSDYIYALYMSYMLPRKIKHIPKYCDIDVSSLVQQDLFMDIFSSGLLRTTLVYRFIYRIKNAGIKIHKVIDWNENQVVDRALNLAIREFYPRTAIIGYQGYIVSNHYVSHSPACYEVNAGTIPDCLCVTTDVLMERNKEFCQQHNVATVPAFRFKKLLEYKRDVNIKKELILVALPYNLNISKEIIKICFEWNKKYGVKFVVKNHPAIPLNDLVNSISHLSDPCFEIISGSLYDLFNHSLLMVSSDSSSCFEAVSCGVHVIIVGNRTGSTPNPLADIVDSNCWDICYDYRCMQKVLDKTHGGCDIDASLLLMPVNEGTIMNFLNYTK